MDDETAIHRHYESIHEGDRLQSGIAQIELLRTKEVLRRFLPDPPARVLDVGGATGIHASWLASNGYQVHVIDLMAHHIEVVQTSLGALGVTAAVGDARQLEVDDGEFDVLLVLGPLYHLTTRSERLRAILEAKRVVRPGGIVALGAISRFASLFDGLARDSLFHLDFRKIVERDLADGQHRNEKNHPGWFTTAYFHKPEDLREEIEEAGLSVLALVGLEGLAGWLEHLSARMENQHDRELIVNSARAIESEPSLLGLSAHLLAIAQK
jgi:2-polyprenyl-3-methyl-5-hydroxy-6-metoxy-1,4-benzoquinol methylase